MSLKSNLKFLKNYCAVAHCNASSTKDPELQFFTFPVALLNSSKKYVVDKSQDRRQKWLEAVGLDVADDRTFVCSKHFVSGHKARFTDFYNVDWVPTVDLKPPLNTKTSSIDPLTVGDDLGTPRMPESNDQNESRIMDPQAQAKKQKISDESQSSKLENCRFRDDDKSSSSKKKIIQKPGLKILHDSESKQSQNQKVGKSHSPKKQQSKKLGSKPLRTLEIDESQKLRTPQPKIPETVRSKNSERKPSQNKNVELSQNSGIEKSQNSKIGKVQNPKTKQLQKAGAEQSENSGTKRLKMNSSHSSEIEKSRNLNKQQSIPPPKPTKSEIQLSNQRKRPESSDPSADDVQSKPLDRPTIKRFKIDKSRVVGESPQSFQIAKFETEMGSAQAKRSDLEESQKIEDDPLQVTSTAQEETPKFPENSEKLCEEKRIPSPDSTSRSKSDTFCENSMTSNSDSDKPDSSSQAKKQKLSNENFNVDEETSSFSLNLSDQSEASKSSIEKKRGTNRLTSRKSKAEMSLEEPKSTKRSRTPGKSMKQDQNQIKISNTNKKQETHPKKQVSEKNLKTDPSSSKKVIPKSAWNSKAMEIFRIVPKENDTGRPRFLAIRKRSKISDSTAESSNCTLLKRSKSIGNIDGSSENDNEKSAQTQKLSIKRIKIVKRTNQRAKSWTPGNDSDSDAETLNIKIRTDKKPDDEEDVKPDVSQLQKRVINPANVKRMLEESFGESDSSMEEDAAMIQKNLKIQQKTPLKIPKMEPTSPKSTTKFPNTARFIQKSSRPPENDLKAPKFGDKSSKATENYPKISKINQKLTKTTPQTLVTGLKSTRAQEVVSNSTKASVIDSKSSKTPLKRLILNKSGSNMSIKTEDLEDPESAKKPTESFPLDQVKQEAESSENLDLLCRVCWQSKSKTHLIPLNKMWQKVKMTIRDVLEYVTPLIIGDNQGCPSNICLQCLEKLEVSYYLKKQCLETNKIVADRFSEEKMGEENVVNEEVEQENRQEIFASEDIVEEVLESVEFETHAHPKSEIVLEKPLIQEVYVSQTPNDSVSYYLGPTEDYQRPINQNTSSNMLMVNQNYEQQQDNVVFVAPDVLQQFPLYDEHGEVIQGVFALEAMENNTMESFPTTSTGNAENIYSLVPQNSAQTLYVSENGEETIKSEFQVYPNLQNTVRPGTNQTINSNGPGKSYDSNADFSYITVRPPNQKSTIRATTSRTNNVQTSNSRRLSQQTLVNPTINQITIRRPNAPATVTSINTFTGNTHNLQSITIRSPNTSTTPQFAKSNQNSQTAAKFKNPQIAVKPQATAKSQYPGTSTTKSHQKDEEYCDEDYDSDIEIPFEEFGDDDYRSSDSSPSSSPVPLENTEQKSQETSSNPKDFNFIVPKKVFPGYKIIGTRPNKAKNPKVVVRKNYENSSTTHEILPRTNREPSPTPSFIANIIEYTPESPGTGPKSTPVYREDMKMLGAGTSKNLKSGEQEMEDGEETFSAKEDGYTEKQIYESQLSESSVISDLLSVKCYICDIRFPSKEKNTEHFSTFHNDENVLKSCQFCNFIALNNTVLNVHISVKHAMRLECGLCKVKFKNSHTLKLHTINNHMTEEERDKHKKFRCDLCGAKFFLNCYLQSHMSHHRANTLKKHVCTEKNCNASYTSSTNLRKHLLTHGYKAPYNCVCAKGFIQKSELARHQKFCRYFNEHIDEHGSPLEDLDK